VDGLGQRQPADTATGNATASRISAVHEREAMNGNIAGRRIDLGAKTRMVEAVLVEIAGLQVCGLKNLNGHGAMILSFVVQEPNDF